MFVFLTEHPADVCLIETGYPRRMDIPFSIGILVVMPMMRSPPYRTFLCRCAAQQREQELKGTARLKTAVREVPMIPPVMPNIRTPYKARQAAPATQLTPTQRAKRQVRCTVQKTTAVVICMNVGYFWERRSSSVMHLLPWRESPKSYIAKPTYHTKLPIEVKVTLRCILYRHHQCYSVRVF